jgi:small-conductance mechanosensitive channel
MKQIVFFLSFLIVSLSAVTGFAANSAPPSNVHPEDVKKLVETLESDTARGDLISNLKLLLEQQKKDEAANEPKPLTEQLGVRSFSQQMLDRYEGFLRKNDLSDGTVRQSVSTGIATLVFAAGLLALGFLTRRLLGVFSRLSEKFDLSMGRLKFYVRAVRFVAWVILGGVYIYTLASIWSLKFASVFTGEVMSSVVPTALNMGVVLLLAALLWEGINILLARTLFGVGDGNESRVRTLLPLVRNVVFVIFAVLFGLVLLSELGINVAPLLAGAGIVGVAVGFGAQTMVKDFLTGFTIVLEDLVRVGDVVKIAGLTGGVEKITLRKVQLRDVAGIVYTIPYSQITTIENLTKDFSYYVMDIGVSYNEDTDRVVDVLRQVDENLRADAEIGPKILEPLEILGVDRFADSAVVIKARIKTLPIQQWNVGREFNRRMKRAFDVAGIEIPFPQRTVTVRNETGAVRAALDAAAD